MKKLSKNEWIAVAVALGFIAYVFFGGSIDGILADFSNSPSNQSMDTTDQAAAANAPQSQVQVQDLVVGSGAEIQKGQQVAVNYVLKLPDGTVLQDSKEVGGGQPFVFSYGAGQVIPGWEMGIEGMKVGGKRIITIPPELGYGAQAVGPIPANSTLVFEIEVVGIQ